MSLRGQAENPCLPDHEAGKVDSLFCYRTGQAVFDVDDAMAREIYADNPVLPRFYKSYADLVYFRLSAATLDYYDLTPGKATARTAADWIDSCVITEAGNMLRYSDMSIKEIVGGLHFPDQSSFTKFFKRKTGQTPRQYSVGPRSGTSA